MRTQRVKGNGQKKISRPAEIYELQLLPGVCFMLFDGSLGERLTVCQCHSLSADVSAPGTGLGKN